MQFPPSSNGSPPAPRCKIPCLSNEHHKHQSEDTRDTRKMNENVPQVSHEESDTTSAGPVSLVSHQIDSPENISQSDSAALRSACFPSAHLLRSLRSTYNSDKANFSLLSGFSDTDTDTNQSIYHRFRTSLKSTSPSSTLAPSFTPTTFVHVMPESSQVVVIDSTKPPLKQTEFMNDTTLPQTKSIDLGTATVCNSNFEGSIASVEKTILLDSNEGPMESVTSPICEGEAKITLSRGDDHKGGSEKVGETTDHSPHTTPTVGDKSVGSTAHWQTYSCNLGPPTSNSGHSFAHEAGEQYTRYPSGNTQAELHALTTWDEAIRAFEALRLHPEARHPCMATANGRIRLALHQAAEHMGALSESKGKGNARRVIMWVDAENLDGITVKADFFQNSLNDIINNVFGPSLPNRTFCSPATIRNNFTTESVPSTDRPQVPQTADLHPHIHLPDNTSDVGQTSPSFRTPHWIPKPRPRARRHRGRGLALAASTAPSNDKRQTGTSTKPRSPF